MNQLITTAGQPATMSSREIAALTERRHDNVMTLCRSMRDMGVCPEIQETPYISEQNGQTYLECRLTKRDSLVLIARISPEFTAAVVDRWQELEAAQAPAPAELSRMDILKLAMESEEARIKAEAERDEAIRTKALIGSKREATAMATAAAKSKEVKRLQQELGRGQMHATVIAVENALKRKFPKNAYVALRKSAKANGVEPITVADPRWGTAKAWPAIAWMDVHGIDLAEIFHTAE